MIAAHVVLPNGQLLHNICNVIMPDGSIRDACVLHTVGKWALIRYLDDPSGPSHWVYKDSAE